jgi:hypothetical protein
LNVGGASCSTAAIKAVASETAVTSNPASERTRDSRLDDPAGGAAKLAQLRAQLSVQAFVLQSEPD